MAKFRNIGALASMQENQDQFDIKHLIANIPKPVRKRPQEISNGYSSGGSSEGNRAPHYANKKGEQIKIESDAELNQLINEFDGQNFVQISLGGNKK